MPFQSSPSSSIAIQNAIPSRLLSISASPQPSRTASNRSRSPNCGRSHHHPLRAPCRHDSGRHRRQIARWLLSRRSLTVNPDRSPCETPRPSRITPTSGFRFPGSLQSVGSGSGKSIKSANNAPSIAVLMLIPTHRLESHSINHPSWPNRRHRAAAIKSPARSRRHGATLGESRAWP